MAELKEEEFISKIKVLLQGLSQGSINRQIQLTEFLQLLHQNKLTPQVHQFLEQLTQIEIKEKEIQKEANEYREKIQELKSILNRLNQELKTLISPTKIKTYQDEIKIYEKHYKEHNEVLTELSLVLHETIKNKKVAYKKLKEIWLIETKPQSDSSNTDSNGSQKFFNKSM